MKITLIVFCIMIFLSDLMQSQQYSFEYGKIGKDEMEMKSFPNDTSAEAVVIYDIGESGFYYIDYEFFIYFKRQMKIKVLKESYLDDATLFIPLAVGSSGEEKLNKIEITTYNLDNSEYKKTVFNKDHIYREKINDYWNRLRIAFPDVRKGSIIEINYEIISPYKLLLRDWKFQNRIPTIYSKYVTKMLPFYEYTYILQGAEKFDESTNYQSKGFGVTVNGKDYKENVYEFVMKNVPSFTDESFISSEDDYLIKLDFQLTKINQLGGGSINILSTWEEVINDLLKEEKFGVYIKKAEKDFSKIIKDNTIISKPENEKIEFVINYLKQNFSVDNNFGEYSYKTINDFLKEKKGNVGAINLYLIGALQVLGLEVYPVILSTRTNGKIIRQYPFIEPFNYVLAYVKYNDKARLLDATDQFCPNDMIPVKCINDVGLIVRKGEVKWIDLSQNHKMSFLQNDFKAELTKKGDTLYGSYVGTTTNYTALGLRKRYENDTEKMAEEILPANSELTDSVTTENYHNISEPYKIKYSLSCVNDRINKKIFIHPFFNDAIKDNPFKEEERKYPVDMIFPKTVNYTSEIKIPEGFTVEQLPEPYSFNTDLFMINYTVNNINGLITVSAAYQFKKAIYQPEDYVKIKRYYGMIIKYLNQNIVISKK